MSTHAMIGLVSPNGAGQSIYCHNDGYPDFPGVVYTLLEYYSQPEQVRELMQTGHRSAIKATPKQSDTHHGRGRAESECHAYNFNGGADGFFRTNWRQQQAYSHWIYCYTPDRGWLAAPAQCPKDPPSDRVTSRIRLLAEWVEQAIMEQQAELTA